MGIVTSFDSLEPDVAVTAVQYMDVVRCWSSDPEEVLDVFAAVAKRHLHQLLPPVRLLASSDDSDTRWAAFLTAVLDKTEAVRYEPLVWREKWATKMHDLTARLAQTIMWDDPQDLALVGALRCAIIPMPDVITISVKQKWTFRGA